MKIPSSKINHIKMSIILLVKTINIYISYIEEEIS